MPKSLKSMKKLLWYALLPGIYLLSVTTVAQDGKTKSAKMKYLDPANMDLSVKPGDNFYLYANGNWLKNNPVLASKTRWGKF